MQTYKIGYRNLSDGVTGVVLTGFRDGLAVTRLKLAYATRAAVIAAVAEICITMAARGVLEVEAA